ncbi:MAG: TPM domain-containing protein [Ferruginibacter sp.]|nr:TPM domain-containing protein [Ferruginibacter sp.]
MFTFRKKKSFFNKEENEKIISAIRDAEKNTSGEIRLFVESKNAYMNPIDRAAEIFFNLEMQKTQQRNGVLIYIAIKSRELAIFADEGIHQMLGTTYWKVSVANMIEEFKQNHISDGIIKSILSIGKTLAEKFPYDGAEDKNELPDEIVFGN